MKRLLISLTLSIASGAALAADETGRIDFTGFVYAGGTCPIELVEAGLGVLPSVSLGNFLPRHFNAVGTTTPDRSFALRVTPDATCVIAPGSKAKITFEALHGAVGTGGELYGLRRGAGTATGLGVLIKDQSNTVLKPNDTSMEYDISSSAATDMLFYAAYKSTAASVTEALAEAQVNFKVELP